MPIDTKGIKSYDVFMELRQYLKLQKMTATTFAEIINYSRVSVTKMMTGKRRPGRKMIEIIVKKTKGQVTKEDLLEPYEKLTENS